MLKNYYPMIKLDKIKIERVVVITFNPVKYYCRAATPGRVLPSIYSNNAPPPVDT